MAEFADQVGYSHYYLPNLFHEEMRKAIRNAVFLAFTGEFAQALELLGNIENTASPELAATFFAGPVYPALLVKLSEGMGDQQTATEMATEVSARGGNLIWAFNDLAVLLAEHGSHQDAFQLFQQLHDRAPDNLTIVVNMMALSVALDDGPALTELSSKLLRLIAGFDEMVREGSKPGGGPYRRLSGSILSNLVGSMMRQERVSLLDETGGGHLSAAFKEILATIDALPDLDRDVYLTGILHASRWDKDALRSLLGDEAASQPLQAAKVLLAGLAFENCEVEAEQRFLDLAEKDEGTLVPLALALLAGEAGDLDREQSLITTLLERQPGESRTWFHLGSNRFRAGDFEAANAAASEGVARSSDVCRELTAAAQHEARHLRRAVEESIAERWPEIDPYADVTWALNYWEKYLFDFQHLTYRQDSTPFLKETYLRTITSMVEKDPQIGMVFNFGAFCGISDYELACRFPDIEVVGFDRDANAIGESSKRFVAPNLRFFCGDFGECLKQLPSKGKSVLVHIRTCTTLYPEGVRQVYQTASQFGFDYIVGIEATGFSFQVGSWPDFLDPDQQPVVPLGVMVDHNYRQLTAEAGYGFYEQQLMLYPFLAPPTVNPEAQTPRRFIASKQGMLGIFDGAYSNMSQDITLKLEVLGFP